MTSAATETRPTDVRSGARHARIDVIGLGALAIAVAGVAVTIAVLLAPATERPPASSAAGVVAPPARDQWYLDQSGQAPGMTEASTISTESTIAAEIATMRTGDQWYLEHTQLAAAPTLADQARDRWYVDGRRSPDIPKDRWYSDPPYRAP